MLEKKSDILVIYPELNEGTNVITAIRFISKCENNYHDLFLGKMEKGKTDRY